MVGGTPDFDLAGLEGCRVRFGRRDFLPKPVAPAGLPGGALALFGA